MQLIAAMSRYELRIFEPPESLVNRAASIAPSVGRKDASRENDAVAPYAAAMPDVGAEFVATRAAKLTCPRHANFSCIMAKVAQNAAATDVDIILKDAISEVAEVGYKDLVAKDAIFDFYRMSNAAIISNVTESAKVGIGANAAIFSNAHMSLDERARFNDRACAQRKNSFDMGGGVDATLNVAFEGLHALGAFFENIPRIFFWGKRHGAEAC